MRTCRLYELNTDKTLKPGINFTFFSYLQIIVNLN